MPSAPIVAAAPSFPNVFREHARFVWRALLGLGVAEADVGDASQQVFVVLYQKLASFDGSSSLRTFLYGICLRVASDHRRRAYRRHERTVADLPEPAANATQDLRAEARESLDRLQKALAAIEPLQRETFVLYEIEELSMSEIAEIMHCPVSTSYSRLRAARQAVMDVLGRSE